MLKKSDPCVIVTHLAGSRAYGTDTPSSDIDIRGIFVAEQKFYRTPLFSLEEVVIETDEDTKLYELNKFIALCTKQSPNVLETLWVDEKALITSSNEYKYLRQHRDLFSSTMLADRFTGFALEHLQKIKNYGLTYEVKSPVMAEFLSPVHRLHGMEAGMRSFDIKNHVDDHALLSYGNEIYGLYKAPGLKSIARDGTVIRHSKEKIGHLTGMPDMLIKFNKAEYERKFAAWRGFWSRTRSKDSTRGILEEKFGYDTKDGMHLVRILRMGLEFMQTGQIMVMRPDANELRMIREEGLLNQEQLADYTEEMTDKIMALKASSPLPSELDFDKIAELTIKIQDMNHRRIIYQKNNDSLSL